MCPTCSYHLWDEIIDKMWIITIMVPWAFSTFEVWNERLFLRVRPL